MPQNIYFDQGAAKTWKDSGGDYAMTMSALAAASGRIGARGDLGAFPKPILYKWYSETQWQSNPVADEGLEWYIAPWDDSATPAGDFANVGSSDAALTSTQRKNLIPLGTVFAEVAGTGTMKGGGTIWLPWRHVTPVCFNNSAAKALASSGTFATLFRLTPAFPQNQ